jgi:alkylation response protein AidB-like acyl-CoA dehydrogenase
VIVADIELDGMTVHAIECTQQSRRSVEATSLHFAYSEEQELLRETTRRFLRDRHPVAALRQRLEARDTFDRDVWRDGAALGWTALLVPESHDGGSVTSQPFVDLAALAEELGRELYPGPVLATNVVADVVARDGSEEQRVRYLASIARGEAAAAWCVTGDGSIDLAGIGVTLSGVSGGARLDGVACFVHDAHVADLLLVTCVAPSGPSLVLVPMPADGVSARVMNGLDLTRRLCEVRFDDVEVPVTDIVGPVGGAAGSIDRGLHLATVFQAAELVGVGEALFERTVQYAKDRKQFGRPIGSFQALKHRLADMLIELEGARASARYAALAVADDRDDVDEAVAVAGSYVRDAIAHLCGESLQLHGGIGFTWEHDVHLYLRRAKSEQVLYGEPWRHRDRLCALVESMVPEKV